MNHDDMQEIADRVYAASAWFLISDVHLRKIILHWYYERKNDEPNCDKIESIITVLRNGGYIVRDTVTGTWRRKK